MKNRFLPTVMALLFLAMQAAIAAETEIPTKITEVTVFRRGAQVIRTGEGRVPAGETILKFTGLAPDLDPNSVLFSATGSFTILSVTTQRNYINPLAENAEVKNLREQLKTLEDRLNAEQAGLQVLNEEESLLLANKEIGGQQTGVQLEELKAMAAYYRTRLKEIKLEKLEVAKRTQSIQEEMERVNRQLNEAAARLRPKVSNEVWVTVRANAPTPTQCTLTYLVRDAGWTPAYDVKVEDIGKPVALHFKGNIFQNTGEDWPKVQLNLSTGNPAEPGTRPALQPWWLQPYEPVVYRARPRADRQLEAPPLAYEEAAKTGAPPPPPPPAEYASVSQVENATTVTYRIDVPYDVPAGGKPYMVSVEQYSLPAEYQYYVAPKLDQNVYLTARVTDWDQYNLLSGEANLFFEGAFLGKSTLDVRNTTDTLELSLGRDKGIVVTRTKEKQFRDKQFIGNKVTQTTGWEIELRNKKSRAVNIVVEDQYPLSTSDEIEVKLENARGAEVDTGNGQLKWALSLDTGKTEKLSFRYSVKYPKKMQLPLE